VKQCVTCHLKPDSRNLIPDKKGHFFSGIEMGY
jgi:hypothetical protein